MIARAQITMLLCYLLINQSLFNIYTPIGSALRDLVSAQDCYCIVRAH